jgi:hypothetical protein
MLGEGGLNGLPVRPVEDGRSGLAERPSERTGDRAPWEVHLASDRFASEKHHGMGKSGLPAKGEGK